MKGYGGQNKLNLSKLMLDQNRHGACGVSFINNALVDNESFYGDWDLGCHSWG